MVQNRVQQGVGTRAAYHDHLKHLLHNARSCSLVGSLSAVGQGYAYPPAAKRQSASIAFSEIKRPRRGTACVGERAQRAHIDTAQLMR